MSTRGEIIDCSKLEGFVLQENNNTTYDNLRALQFYQKRRKSNYLCRQ